MHDDPPTDPPEYLDALLSAERAQALGERLRSQHQVLLERKPDWPWWWEWSIIERAYPDCVIFDGCAPSETLARHQAAERLDLYLQDLGTDACGP